MLIRPRTEKHCQTHRQTRVCAHARAALDLLKYRVIRVQASPSVNLKLRSAWQGEQAEMCRAVAPAIVDISWATLIRNRVEASCEASKAWKQEYRCNDCNEKLEATTWCCIPRVPSASLIGGLEVQRGNYGSYWLDSHRCHDLTD